MSPDTSFSLPDFLKKRYDFCRASLANHNPQAGLRGHVWPNLSLGAF
jgi:hypothetical protein